MTSIRALSISAAAALLLGSAALAQDALSGISQTEWAEGFDSQSTVTRPVTTSTPILSPSTLPAMEQAILAQQGPTKSPLDDLVRQVNAILPQE